MNMADRARLRALICRKMLATMGNQQYPEPDEQHAAEEGEVPLGGQGMADRPKKVSAVPPSAVITISPPPLFMRTC